jgi:hypothetical protein
MVRNVALLSVLILVWSCDKESDPTPKDLIVGNWTVTTFDVDIKVGSLSLFDFLKSFGYTDAEAQLEVSQLENSMEINGQSFNIKSDGTYSTTSQGVTENGTWELSSDGKTFTVDKGTAEAIVFTVTSLTSSNLNLTASQNVTDSGFTLTFLIDMKMTK